VRPRIRRTDHEPKITPEKDAPTETTRLKRTEDIPIIRAIISGATAIAAGFGTASLQAWKGHGWEFSGQTLLEFLIGAAVMVGYWRIMFHPSSSRRQKALRFAATILIFLAGVAFFLYPLKFVQAAFLPEIRTGLITALCALSGVCALLFLAKRLFDDKSG